LQVKTRNGQSKLYFSTEHILKNISTIPRKHSSQITNHNHKFKSQARTITEKQNHYLTAITTTALRLQPI